MGGLRIDITPRREEAAELVVFAVGGHPRYLFVRDGLGYEFWRDDESDVQLLQELRKASLAGRQVLDRAVKSSRVV